MDRPKHTIETYIDLIRIGLPKDLVGGKYYKQLDAAKKSLEKLSKTIKSVTNNKLEL